MSCSAGGGERIFCKARLSPLYGAFKPSPWRLISRRASARSRSRGLHTQRIYPPNSRTSSEFRNLLDIPRASHQIEGEAALRRDDLSRSTSRLLRSVSRIKPLTATGTAEGAFERTSSECCDHPTGRLS